MFKFKRKPQTNRREGISIIEVLTSMAVATIGVFGVMVMIPFAVKQSQRGLDNDAASVAGRNAIEKIQLEGYLTVDEATIGGQLNEVLPGLIFVPDPGVGELNCNLSRVGQTATIAGITFEFPGLIHFDPIGFTGGLTEFTVDPGGDDLTITSANAARRAFVDVNGNRVFDLGEPAQGGSVTDREAARLCRSTDQMFYEEDTDDEDAIAPPQPLFNVDSVSNSLSTRQSSGRISWSAFLVPEKHPSLTSSPVSRFRTHVLVYRDRFVDPANAVVHKTSEPFNENLKGSSYDYYLTNMAGGGFVPSVSQITFARDIIDTKELARGDWVMLVNRIPEAVPGTPIRVIGGIEFRVAEPGFRTQIMFAKVTRVAANSVSVEGGAFDFSPAANMLGSSVNPTSSETYMVHLKDVVNVYERSASVER